MGREMKLKARVVLSFLTAGALVLSIGCASRQDYFGRTTPPTRQRLVYNNTAEPDSLDPHRVNTQSTFLILDTLFDGLTKSHPQTLEPMAGLATHYRINADGTQFTFYLRGHPRPEGTRLPNTDTLREEYAAGKLEDDFARGHAAPPDNVAARWSDGTIITAHDFVYSWRRAVDPRTAADNANLLYFIAHAEEINEGKVRLFDAARGSFRTDSATGAPLVTTEKKIKTDAHLAALAANSEVVKFTPADLGVRALDDFTFQVDLRGPTAFFLKMLYHPIYAAVPRQSIEAALARGLESTWTRPEHIVTSGAFTLEKWRPYDRVDVAKNPRYYEADTVALEEISFLPITDQTAGINLYKAGSVDLMFTNRVPQAFIPVLRQMKDFRLSPAVSAVLPRINTRRPPFDNVLVRYALNMATDKKALADFLGAGQLPAPNVIPPMTGYDAPQRLDVEVAGKTYDVLAYDPEGARQLLARAGYPGGVGPDGHRLKIEFMGPAESARQPPEIIQQQWRQNLNVDVDVSIQEFKVFIRTQNDLEYNGVSYSAWIGDYIDPNTFLDVFTANSANNASGWSDSRYDAMLADANAIVDEAARSLKLIECEKYLLRAMPMLPLYFQTNYFLQKPYVRGYVPTLNEIHPFKYVWIDTDWKPQGHDKD